jgi:hypothetical protein
MSINTLIGAGVWFKNLQFIVSQRDNPIGAGGVYEVVSE